MAPYLQTLTAAILFNTVNLQMKPIHLSILTFSLLAGTTYTQSTSTFWNDYPPCERQCHQNIYGNQSCTLENSCACSGCLCLADSCLCVTSSWLIAVTQCIGQECGASAVSDAAGVASSACVGNGYPLVVSEQSLINEGLAAISSTTSPATTKTTSLSLPVSSTSAPATSTPNAQSQPSPSQTSSSPSISATNNPIHRGLSTAVVAVISVLAAVLVALLIGGFLYWKHKKRRLGRELEAINNRRNEEGRSTVDAPKYQQTLITDSSDIRAAAIPGWASNISRSDAIGLQEMERPTVPQSESGISGATTLNQGSQVSRWS